VAAAIPLSEPRPITAPALEDLKEFVFRCFCGQVTKCMCVLLLETNRFATVGHMAVHRADFEEGRRLTSDDYDTLSTGTLVFWKGTLLEFFRRNGGSRGLQVCLREPNSKVPSGTPLITSLHLAVAKQEEYNTSDESSSDDEQALLEEEIAKLRARLTSLKLRRAPK